jgi:hypothetical protein
VTAGTTFVPFGDENRLQFQPENATSEEWKKGSHQAM